MKVIRHFTHGNAIVTEQMLDFYPGLPKIDLFQLRVTNCDVLGSTEEPSKNLFL